METNTSEDIDTEPEKSTPNTSSTRKHHRKRKRHYYHAIRSQMEFYFGDANLSKDRYLGHLLLKEPFVPLEMFLSFNKMKVLAGSVEEIAKSLTNSQMLELNDTQLKVRRRFALPTARNVDEKTLYVEALPPNADHDWVRSVFERFGSVTYVSLPKFAKSRKIKEFGFVEFALEESVAKAVKAFSEFNGVLDMQLADPAELSSVKAFIKEQGSEESVATIDKTEPLEERVIKREKTDEQDEEPRAKRIKTEEENAESTAAEDEVGDADGSTSAAGNTAVEGESQGENHKETVKKRRKKKKKIKSSEKHKKGAELNLEAAYYELKVLPKVSWKRLRNKYLNLQRERMSEIKRAAWKERQQQAAQQAKEQQMQDSGDATTTPAAKKPKQSNKRKLQQKMNMNFYGAGDEESPLGGQKMSIKEAKQNPALERAPLFSYEPGLIVEVNLLEPCVHLKEFKTDMRQYGSVKYVDIKEGAMQAHLRLDNAGAAEDFVRQVNSAENQCKVLAGEAEQEYWRKIELDREQKLNKQVKVVHKRGREKMRKLATQHLRFGDDEEDKEY